MACIVLFSSRCLEAESFSSSFGLHLGVTLTLSACRMNCLIVHSSKSKYFEWSGFNEVWPSKETLKFNNMYKNNPTKNANFHTRMVRTMKQGTLNLIFSEDRK